MFGYVFPPIKELTETEYLDFKSAYCGLCHQIGKMYGPFARLFLSYDITFLVLLFSLDMDSCEKQSCISHPFTKCCVLKQNDILKVAASISVVLSYWQVQDGLQDCHSIKKIKYIIANSLIKHAYDVAKINVSKFDLLTKNCLIELNELEKIKSKSIDMTSDCFAKILVGTIDSFNIDDLSLIRISKEILYHIGRWIYLIDAVDDLQDDMKHCSYNPIVYRFQLDSSVLNDEQRILLDGTLSASISSIARAFELYDFKNNALLKKIIYIGLPSVQNSVFNGNFRKPKRTMIGVIH